MNDDLNLALIDDHNDNNDNNHNNNNNDNNNNNENEFIINNNEANLNNYAYFYQPQNDNNAITSCRRISFLITLIIILFYFEFSNLYYSIKNLFYDIKTIPDDVIDKCIKYPDLTQIYCSIFFIFLILDILLFFIILQIQDEELASKIFLSYGHLNFYLFGPLATGFSLLGLIFYDKVCYICENDNPIYRYFDYSTFLLCLIWLFIGINVLLGYNSMQTYKFFQESITFKEDGSYFLGKLFWKVANWRRLNNHN